MKKFQKLIAVFLSLLFVLTVLSSSMIAFAKEEVFQSSDSPALLEDDNGEREIENRAGILDWIIDQNIRVEIDITCRRNPFDNSITISFRNDGTMTGEINGYIYLYDNIGNFPNLIGSGKVSDEVIGSHLSFTKVFTPTRKGKVTSVGYTLTVNMPGYTKGETFSGTITDIKDI